MKSAELDAYVSAARRYPLLSREQEHELAVRYQQTADPALGQRLVTANLRLVVKIAVGYRGLAPILDLVQEGNVGLIEAVQKYDPHRGVKLSSFAAWWIRARIQHYLIDNHRVVKIGTTQAQRKIFFNLSKERRRLEAAGQEATSETIAQALGVPVRQVAEMKLRLGRSEVALDAALDTSDHRARPDELVEQRELDQRLQDLLRRFRPYGDVEATLLSLRLLAKEEPPLSLAEVGQACGGLSRERVRQIEVGLRGRLRRHLAEVAP